MMCSVQNVNIIVFFSIRLQPGRFYFITVDQPHGQVLTTTEGDQQVQAAGQQNDCELYLGLVK